MEPQENSMPMAFQEAGPKAITFERKKEIVKLAEQTAMQLTAKLEPHELCYFRRAVEMFLDQRF